MNISGSELPRNDNPSAEQSAFLTCSGLSDVLSTQITARENSFSRLAYIPPHVSKSGRHRETFLFVAPQTIRERSNPPNRIVFDPTARRISFALEPCRAFSRSLKQWITCRFQESKIRVGDKD